MLRLNISSTVYHAHYSSTVYHAHYSSTVYTMHTIPLQYTMHTIPLQYTMHAIPLQYTMHTIPLQYTMHTIPLQYTMHTIPLQYTMHTIPLWHILFLSLRYLRTVRTLGATSRGSKSKYPLAGGYKSLQNRVYTEESYRFVLFVLRRYSYPKYLHAHLTARLAPIVYAPASHVFN